MRMQGDRGLIVMSRSAIAAACIIFVAVTMARSGKWGYHTI